MKDRETVKLFNSPCCEKPWINAPITMISEPPKMDHRRPNLSFTMGINGRDIMAPNEYAAAMMPLSEPSGFSKSTQSQPVSIFWPLTNILPLVQLIWEWGLTSIPCWYNLQSIDHLGVKAGRQFDAHTCWEQHKVEVSQVRLLPPCNAIFAHETRDDRVGLADFCSR